MEGTGTLANFRALFDDPAHTSGVMESLSALNKAKKGHKATLALFNPLYRKVDSFISSMSVNPDDIEDASNVLKLINTLIVDNNAAIQVSPFMDSKDKITKLNDRLSFIAEFYEFWIDTELSIKAPESECVTLEEL